MRVLVTGATGFVGSHLVRRLLDRGHTARALARDPARARDLVRAGSEVVVGRLEDASSLREATRDVEAVVHSAALLSSPIRADYLRVNAEGTDRLLGAALENGCAAFVLISSLAAAGPSRLGAPASAGDPPRPVSHYGRSKLEAERILTRAGGRLRTCAIRPPIVYGPGDRGMLPFFRAAARGIAPSLGRVRSIDLIEVSDLCEAILEAIERPLPSGCAHFVRGEGPRSPEEVLGIAARAFGVRTRRLRIPDAAVVAAGAATDLWSLALRARGRALPVFGLDKWREMREEAWTCDDAPFRAATGWEPKVELEPGFAATARWYLEHGWVARGRGRAAT